MGSPVRLINSLPNKKCKKEIRADPLKIMSAIYPIRFRSAVLAKSVSVERRICAASIANYN